MMSREDRAYQEVQDRLKDLTSETPPERVRDALKPLIPLFARFDEMEFESLWAKLGERLNLKGPFFAALRRKIKEVRKEQKKSDPIKEAPDLSQEEELETLNPLADPLAQCPDILGEVVAVLNRLGLAGQEREAKIIYLALTSRIFERLVNVAVKGPSSGGKSFLVEQCLKLMPESAYYALSAMSEKALAYSQEPMSHRHLVIFEAAGLGGEFAQYLMRSLLSEGRIRYETVDKTKDEGHKARLIEREGPTGLIITTTRAGLHPENETRILSLEADDSPKQTMAVILACAKETKQTAVDLTPFKALQRILELKSPRVIIPYAKPLALGCNPTAVRLRRDFPMVLYLVKAHAALHCHSRPTDEQGRIIATYADYQAVYDLIADIVAYGTGLNISDSVRETLAAVEALVGDDPEHPGVSVKDVAKQLGRDESTASRRVRVALKKGHLENKEPRKYAPYKLVLGAPVPDHQGVLPTPDKIKEISYLPETGATLQPHKGIFDKPDSYGLQSPLQPSCNMQPPGTELHDCAAEIQHATHHATDNICKLHENIVTVAGLHGNPGGTNDKNLSLFSGEEFDL